jgi:hypothetical protein
VERQQLKEQREMAKKAKAEELAAACALKKLKLDAATSQNLTIHPKRAIEKSHTKLLKFRQNVVVL